VEEMAAQLREEPNRKILSRTTLQRALSAPSFFYHPEQISALSKSQEKEIETQFKLTSMRLQ